MKDAKQLSVCNQTVPDLVADNKPVHDNNSVSATTFRYSQNY